MAEPEAASGRCCLRGKVRHHLADEVVVGQLLKTRDGDTALGMSAPAQGPTCEPAVTWANWQGPWWVEGATGVARHWTAEGLGGPGKSLDFI